MVHSYIRGSSLRRWLARDDCPPIIKACKTLFDKAFASKSADMTNNNTGDSNPSALPVSLPDDLRATSNLLKAVMLSRCKYRGVFLSRASTHLGNSLVHFYPRGDLKSNLVPGCIQYIYQNASMTYLAIRRHRDLKDEVIDPFSRYPHFPAKLYSSSLSPTLEIVQVGWVHGHFARWQVSPSWVVVLSLCRVCSLLIYHFSGLTFYFLGLNALYGII